LEGSPQFLQRIGTVIDNDNFSLTLKNGVCYLESNQFTPDLSLEQIFKLAEEKLNIVRGMAAINPEIFPPREMKIAGVAIVNPGGEILTTYQHNDFAMKYDAASNSMNCEGDPLNEPNRWMSLAINDEAVAKVFRLLNYNINDYVNSYRIYEVVRKELKDAKKGFGVIGISENEASRFTGTVNRPDVVGDLARHGYMPGKPMEARPMSTSEIGEFIQRMVSAWIRHKVESAREVNG
jgi:hypothetical protein